MCVCSRCSHIEHKIPVNCLQDFKNKFLYIWVMKCTERIRHVQNIVFWTITMLKTKKIEILWPWLIYCNDFPWSLCYYSIATLWCCKKSVYVWATISQIKLVLVIIPTYTCQLLTCHFVANAHLKWVSSAKKCGKGHIKCNKD